ncbi:MAG TPA: ferrous iron transport protein B [Selenomonadales bacterium]|nr:ferrous iron transport protein B [Selenomonadales bacterium]
MEIANSFTIGLLGQPNTGKSTLFNRLTNSRQHVGNWPGKTVEQKTGEYRHNHYLYHIVDLPGTYSLSANSEEEIVTRGFVFSGKGDAIIALIDASQLERSLYLLADFAGVDIPVVVALNMIDIAEQNGKKIEYKKIEDKLGIPVIPMVATKGNGFAELLDQVEQTIGQAKMMKIDGLLQKYRQAFGEKFDNLLNVLPDGGIGQYSAIWVALKLLENDKQIADVAKDGLAQDAWQDIRAIVGETPEGALSAANCKYGWIDSILQGAVEKPDRKRRRKGFDRAATHPVWGIPLALLSMLLAFAASMGVALPWMLAVFKLIPLTSLSLREIFLNAGMPAIFTSLAVEAVIPAAYWALFMGIFVSGVSLVFGFMEDVGYMARVAYVFDGVMGKIGLHGKAVMPFVLSFGCNIAGITGARVIDSWKQRLLTIGTSWVIPCTAIWGVVGLVGSLFFGPGVVWVMTSLFIAMIIHIMFTSWFFRKLLYTKEESAGLIMELPPYHRPNWKTIFSYVKGRVTGVFSKAFKVIMGVSIAMWAFSYSADGNIEHSLIYPVGKFIEPAGRLFGLDWRLFIAFIVSAMGKEAALGVIAMLYGAGGGLSSFTGTMVSGALQYNQANLAAALSSSVSKPEALAFIYAFFFNVPCMASIASAGIETHSVKWPLILVVYYVVTALLIGGVAYRVGTGLF